MQGAQSAHAQQKLLANANAKIASVQAGGQLPVLGGVSFHVGVEQQKIAPAHLNAPDLCPDAPAASFNLHHDRSAVFSDRYFHRQLGDVGLEIFFPLPSVDIEALPEISLAVEQPDSNQRDVKVRSALDVVAS